jgi:hypothetical protein
MVVRTLLDRTWLIAKRSASPEGPLAPWPQFGVPFHQFPEIVDGFYTCQKLSRNSAPFNHFPSVTDVRLESPVDTQKVFYCASRFLDQHQSVETQLALKRHKHMRTSP